MINYKAEKLTELIKDYLMIPYKIDSERQTKPSTSASNYAEMELRNSAIKGEDLVYVLKEIKNYYEGIEKKNIAITNLVNKMKDNNETSFSEMEKIIKQEKQKTSSKSQ